MKLCLAILKIKKNIKITMKGILSIRSSVAGEFKSKHPIILLQRHIDDENWIHCMLHLCISKWIRDEMYKREVFFMYCRDPKRMRYFAYRTNRMIHLGTTIPGMQ